MIMKVMMVLINIKNNRDDGNGGYLFCKKLS